MSDERKKVLEWVDNALSEGTVSILEGWDTNATLLCTRAEGFDEARNQRIWLMEENRSAPRDVRCAECGEFVVMSNGLYKRFVAAGRLNVVLCDVCVIGQALAMRSSPK